MSDVPAGTRPDEPDEFSDDALADAIYATYTSSMPIITPEMLAEAAAEKAETEPVADLDPVDDSEAGAFEAQAEAEPTPEPAAASQPEAAPEAAIAAEEPEADVQSEADVQPEPQPDPLSVPVDDSWPAPVVESEPDPEPAVVQEEEPAAADEAASTAAEAEPSSAPWEPDSTWAPPAPWTPDEDAAEPGNDADADDAPIAEAEPEPIAAPVTTPWWESAAPPVAEEVPVDTDVSAEPVAAPTPWWEAAEEPAAEAAAETTAEAEAPPAPWWVTDSVTDEPISAENVSAAAEPSEDASGAPAETSPPQAEPEPYFDPTAYAPPTPANATTEPEQLPEPQPWKYQPAPMAPLSDSARSTAYPPDAVWDLAPAESDPEPELDPHEDVRDEVSEVDEEAEQPLTPMDPPLDAEPIDLGSPDFPLPWVDLPAPAPESVESDGHQWTEDAGRPVTPFEVPWTPDAPADWTNSLADGSSDDGAEAETAAPAEADASTTSPAPTDPVAGSWPSWASAAPPVVDVPGEDGDADIEHDVAGGDEPLTPAAEQWQPAVWEPRAWSPEQESVDEVGTFEKFGGENSLAPTDPPIDDDILRSYGGAAASDLQESIQRFDDELREPAPPTDVPPGFESLLLGNLAAAPPPDPTQAVAQSDVVLPPPPPAFADAPQDSDDALPAAAPTPPPGLPMGPPVGAPAGVSIDQPPTAPVSEPVDDGATSSETADPEHDPEVPESIPDAPASPSPFGPPDASAIAGTNSGVPPTPQSRFAPPPEAYGVSTVPPGQPWNIAPPPVYTPPALVEPPVPESTRPPLVQHDDSSSEPTAAPDTGSETAVDLDAQGEPAAPSAPEPAAERVPPPDTEGAWDDDAPSDLTKLPAPEGPAADPFDSEPPDLGQRGADSDATESVDADSNDDGDRVDGPPTAALDAEALALLATLPPPTAIASADVPPPAEIDPELRPGDADYIDDDDGSVDDSDRVSPEVYTGSIVTTVLPPAAEQDDSLPEPTEQETPVAPGVLPIESVGVEPTPLDRRAGRAGRMFWLWFAVNASVLSTSIGAVVFSAGVSLRQGIVAVLAGVAVSFLPLGLGTLAGKWSGQPTMVVSRASFGHIGNVLPALLAVFSRAFWGGALLWLGATGVTGLLTAVGGLEPTGIFSWVSLAVAALLAGAVAMLGYGMIARLQLVLSVLSGIMVVALIVITAPRLSLDTALMIPDGSWLLVVGGAALVFSFLGAAWAQSGSDLARYQNPGSRGATTMLSATFGAMLPALALLVWGVLLAASDDGLALQLVTSPGDALVGLVPSWFAVPLLVSIILSSISAFTVSSYSGGFAVLSSGLKVGRPGATLIAVILGIAAAALLLTDGSGSGERVRDLATTLAVPLAAWAGIFGAEMMIRTRRFHTPSLLARGQIYPDVRVANTVALIVIPVIGFGLTGATTAGLAWQGYLLRLFGLDDAWAASDIGVFVALVLGLLVPLVTAVRTIREQESARAMPAPALSGSALSGSAPSGSALS